MNKKFYVSLMLSVFLLMVYENGYSQSEMPPELTSGSITEQIKYLQERTRIYENYRAIREDMFQKLSRNVLDTIALKQSRIEELAWNHASLVSKYDSVNVLLGRADENLIQALDTKNSIKVLGVEVRKNAYNSVMVTVILALLAVLLLGFIAFRRNLIVMSRTTKDLKDIREEFETYRQTTRIAREKMQMDHFNEIKKLKGK